MSTTVYPLASELWPTARVVAVPSVRKSVSVDVSMSKCTKTSTSTNMIVIVVMITVALSMVCA